MLDLRFYILHGKVAKVAKMNLSLKLYILTNVIGVHCTRSHVSPGEEEEEMRRMWQKASVPPNNAKTLTF